MPTSALVRLMAIALIVLAPAVASAQPEREGFTLLVNLGSGFQRDTGIDESAVGLAGANLGLGGFLTPKLALMGRFSGTNVSYDFFNQVSGTVNASIQYWVSDYVAVEAGGGLGFWRSDFEEDTGPGLILGIDFTVFNRGKHNLQVGVEYAPAFTNDPVHNIGITFGYQLF